MRARRVFLSSLVVLIVILQSCSFKYEIIYDGFSSEGIHSRGLALTEDRIYVGGERGIISSFDYEGNDKGRDVVNNIEDFRDIDVVHDSTVLYLNSGSNGIIVRQERGQPKQNVFVQPGVFLDGMDFWDDQNGMAYGDPLKRRFFILTTDNSGGSWTRLKPEVLPNPVDNEAGFAASGTGLDCVGDSTVFIGTGMCKSPRVLVSHDRGASWEAKETPMVGGDSHGIYSLYFWNENEGVIIGGSYVYPDLNDSICFYTPDGGNTWLDRSNGLGGYCSTIQGNKDGSLLIASGRTATYYSTNKGETWDLLFEETYYSCKVNDEYIVFSGKKGKFRILKYRN